ncbi:branched-chain amino acid ABC transporter substrate-binding protein [Longispora albida]|uniref:branched-chain amino acid ABC transporter substrate-binding protein n=1 Tax=Longispora albida TaxID=203523 RepID=UPI0003775F98|nr:branched-chain amino acid ABC transporter substrate-binding protein [Longispora albida]
MKLRAAAILAVLLALPGCSGGLFGGGDDTSEIVLGMPVPLSGDSAAIGPYMRNGAQLAIDELNAKGGVLGRKLKLAAEDDACDPQTATAAATKLVSQKVVASVGGYCSGATLPTLPVFDRAKIPVVIPAANSDQLFEKKLPYVFLINSTGTQQAGTAVEWATKQSLSRVVVVHDNTSYSKNIADLTSAALKERSAGSVVITKGEAEHGPAVTAVRAKNPDLVYFTGYYADGGLFIRQLRQAGYTGKIMVADGSVDKQLITIAGQDKAQGVYATMTGLPEFTPGAEQWISKYKEKFGSEPGPYSTQSYDAVRLVADALTRAASTDGDKLRKALEETKAFPMFSGPLSFTPQHTLAVSGFVILEVKGSRFELVK